MQFNYHFLVHLVPALHAQLRGWTLLAAFSQSKDELVLGFGRHDQEFYLRADLSPDGGHLAFADHFHRARHNSADLLPTALGRTVEQVRTVPHDRSFFMDLSGGGALLFKLHGRRANLLLTDANGRVTDQFHRKYHDDAHLDVRTLPRHPDQSHAHFMAQGGALPALFPTFGPLVRRYLDGRGWATATPDQRWHLVQEVLAALARPDFYLVADPDGTVHLSLLPVGQVQAHTTAPLEAANLYARHHTRRHTLAGEQRHALRELDRRRAQLERALDKADERLRVLTHEGRYEQLAHVLMANLHQVPPRATEVTLHDFYHDRPVTLRLNPALSPQHNAERLYRKAKNQQREIDQLRATQQARRQELATLATHHATVAATDDVRTLRGHVKAAGLRQEGAAPAARLPYRRFTCEGFQIWVGKSAKDNDALTLRHGYKEDLWLHARDVSGSHVLLKHQANRPFPPAVVEKAAALAAWYSKRKTDTLCPVICTPKKYVRKTKGAPPGQVVVEKEKVLLVEPRPFADHA